MKTIFINAAAVGTGGFVGALLRYGLSGLAHRFAPLTTFPVGTLTVNLLGCFLIGAFAGLAESRYLLGPELRTFMLIGVLGGFTTFSSFGLETMSLLQDKMYFQAAANVSSHVFLGLALVWFGYTLMTWR